MTTPTTKIVIVSGQEFSVPAETDNEAIRQQLTSMGFADVASATIQKGKRTVEGQEVETIEFVKKAGTKGLDGAELAELLRAVQQASLPPSIAYGPTAEQSLLLSRLADHELTFDEALKLEEQLASALDACSEMPPVWKREGAELCRTIDHLVAVPCSASFAW